MPRNTTDEGDDGLEANPERRSSSLVNKQQDAYYDDDDYSDGDEEDLELIELERRLNEEVDEDFFTEPKRFNTIHRVIDVLGIQMIDDATVQHSDNELAKNPAYRNLKDQQKIVEGAIEHMAVIHCADLNGSVIQVGKVARQFNDAVSKVRSLRKQVRDIQDTLGAKNSQDAPKSAAQNSEQRPQNAAAMSLRELWLKKLECEASLGLLEKLDVIRAAPARFDHYISQTPCRIGAAVLQVSMALQTMFSDDVAQVQALHKIMEQLMIRKQKAEEILWDTLADIVYLRTGNGFKKTQASPSVAFRSSATVASTSSGRSFHTTIGKKKTKYHVNGIYNPFAARSMDFDQTTADLNSDDQSTASEGSGASLFSHESGDEDDMEALETGSTTSLLRRKTSKAMMIPIPQLDAELDLEADERRAMEEMALMGHIPQASSRQPVPRYADPIMALRIVVECLARLKRLDDVERIVLENLEKEVTTIRQRQQARTFSRLEDNSAPQSIRSAGKTLDLTDFRRHLTELLAAFGCVYLRLSHLAQILRWRITSDKELLQTVESPSAIMRSVLTAASSIMQKEVRAFLEATLHETDLSKTMDNTVRNVGYNESGLFSLGIVETAPKEPNVATATRSNVMEMSTAMFVTSVLFSKTKSTPQVRHALTFRRSLARWTSTLENAKKELAEITGEDVTAPSFNTVTEETVISYLDNVIQNDLLPVLQEEAVNGTVQGLERRDAFDPVLDRTLYARPGSNEPQDVDMCMACQAMFQFTGPLFMALHRLPRDGDMYLPLVAVLEHVVLTFISRVKQQVGTICNGKTALNLLMQEASESTSFSSMCERRRPYRQLLQAYSTDEAVLDSAGGEQLNQQSGLMPLTPSPSDTSRRPSSDGLKGARTVDEIADGVEGEEAVLQFELSFLKPYLDFSSENKRITVASDEELMRAACLGHSLMKLAGYLEDRLMIKSSNRKSRTLTSTRALREAIKTIKAHGIKMAKFCRLDMLMQTLQRLSRVCRSSTLVAQDAVRIPSNVNDLGEYITAASDNLREAAGNAITAYTFSSLEQYIPYFLMQTVRVVAQGKGIVAKSPLTLNGVEALDRSGSVLYRDLKGATSFDNSFWDVELAAAAFEQSAGFMAMLEFDMEELVAYYAANRDDFSEADFELMFSMTGPRRRGDVGRYHMARRQLG